jgi:heat shock protein 4
VTFKRSTAFDIAAEYDASPDSPLAPGAQRALGRFTLSGFPAEAAEAAAGPAPPKVRVDFKHDINGIFSIARAEVMVSKEVPAEAEAEAAAPAAPAAAAANGDKMDTSVPGEAGAAPAADAAPAAAAAAAPAAEAPKKRRVKRFDLAVLPAGGRSLALSAAEVARLAAAEAKMIAQDADIHATQDARNTLETYIYNTRNALEDALIPYGTAAEREALGGALSDMESWLYGDGFEADRATYAAKLKSLQALGNPLIARKAEHEGRAEAGAALLRTVDDFRAIINNRDGKHAHLSDSDRDVMRAACSEAEAWFRGKQDEQGALDLTVDPVLKVGEINARRSGLVKELAPIANKPVPAPAPAAPPAAAAAQQPPPAPAQAGEGEADAAGAAPAGDAQAGGGDAPQQMEMEQ